MLVIDKNIKNNYYDSMKIKDRNEKKDIMGELINTKKRVGSVNEIIRNVKIIDNQTIS